MDSTPFMCLLGHGSHIIMSYYCYVLLGNFWKEGSFCVFVSWKCLLSCMNAIFIEHDIQN